MRFANIVSDIRKLILNSNSPFFIFDNDPDGLCSFLVLYKKFRKGSFRCSTSSPHDMEFYEKIISEKDPDLIIFLDRPFLSQNFVDNCEVPIIWIDHHPPLNIKKILYLNSRHFGMTNPTSYLAYKIAGQEKFISALGCVADWHIPDFFEEVRREHYNLIGSAKKPGEILFKTNFGLIVRMLSFNLVGDEKEIEKSIEILTNSENIHEILNCKNQFDFLCRKFKKVNSKYRSLLEEAQQEISDDILILFTYSSGISLTGELSDELMFKNPEKVVIVARKHKENYKMSLRSMKFNLHKPLNESLKGLRGLGGGHEHACGANIYYRDFEKFVNSFRECLMQEKNSMIS